jgi:hypothetical protein
VASGAGSRPQAGDRCATVIADRLERDTALAGRVRRRAGQLLARAPQRRPEGRPLAGTGHPHRTELTDSLTRSPDRSPIAGDTAVLSQRPRFEISLEITDDRIYEPYAPPL